MAIDATYSTACVNTLANALGALLNGGFLSIYDGAQPASPDVAVSTQNLLAQLQFGNPAFNAAASGTITANVITGGNALMTTTTGASWYRCLKSDGVTAVHDGSVGTANANMTLPSVMIQANAPVSVTAFSLTVAEH